ncbi:unnamed protein product, partial [Lampetra planeri]
MSAAGSAHEGSGGPRAPVPRSGLHPALVWARSGSAGGTRGCGCMSDPLQVPGEHGGLPRPGDPRCPQEHPQRHREARSEWEQPDHHHQDGLLGPQTPQSAPPHGESDHQRGARSAGRAEGAGATSPEQEPTQSNSRAAVSEERSFVTFV